jgi:hypothetical protein
MANRKVRNTAILAKAEVTYNVDPVPTGAANALLISNQTVNPLNAQNVDRSLTRNYLGGSEHLVGTAFIEVGFDVELQGSGAAGTAPAYGVLLRGCGMAEAITASTRVDYTFISTAEESLTIYYYDDGALHKLTGARGSFELVAEIGQKPVLRFKFIGIDAGISAAALPTTTLTGWIKPLVITDANTGDITLGCTYSAGSLSGGTAYPSRGITINSGITVNHIPELGGESVDISERDVTGKMMLDLTAAQEVTLMATVKANTTQGLGLVHGTAAGQKVTIFGTNAQLLNPTKEEVSGKRFVGYDVRFTALAANDDFRIVVA